MSIIQRSLTLLLASGLTTALQLNVASSGGNRTSGLQYGIMFEDINHSGDGGIYAELIQNRAFQHSNSFEPWTASSATLSLDSTSPLSRALPQSLKVTPGGNAASVDLNNPGWWGIDVRPQKYTGSFYVRGSYTGAFTASLISSHGQVLASTNITCTTTPDTWTQHNFTLAPQTSGPDTNNTFRLSFERAGANGSLNFNLISLFPPTYKNRPNGLRIDLMNLLAELRPRFLRIGGNNIESDNVPSQWHWYNAVGPLKDRPGRQGTWSYVNTDGLGLAELLDWCVDLGLEPILGIPDGLFLNKSIVPEADLYKWVQEALDELEYVKGDVSTRYGALRASHGYPIPWKVRYVEVGNEDNLNEGLSSYNAYRFEAFNKAVKAKYPDITIIASTAAASVPKGTVVDYHEYTTPDKFVSQFNFFDVNATSDRKVLIGEYATNMDNGNPNGGVGRSLSFPTWVGAVGEAVFLIGAERNAAGILGASYAPLFQNLNSFQWVPDLISFTADASKNVKSTSYHSIQLFARTLFTETLPAKADCDFGPVYWVAGKNTEEGFYGAKFAVYNSTGPSTISVSLPVAAGTKATLCVLTAPDAHAQSSPGRDPVVETTTQIQSGSDGFKFTLPNLSVAVLRT